MQTRSESEDATDFPACCPIGAALGDVRNRFNHHTRQRLAQVLLREDV